jgi:hypothetical protein
MHGCPLRAARSISGRMVVVGCELVRLRVTFREDVSEVAPRNKSHSTDSEPRAESTAHVPSIVLNSIVEILIQLAVLTRSCQGSEFTIRSKNRSAPS